jgi:hypothetical protein
MARVWKMEAVMCTSDMRLRHRSVPPRPSLAAMDSTEPMAGRASRAPSRSQGCWCAACHADPVRCRASPAQVSTRVPAAPAHATPARPAAAWHRRRRAVSWRLQNIAPVRRRIDSYRRHARSWRTWNGLGTALRHAGLGVHAQRANRPDWRALSRSRADIEASCSLTSGDGEALAFPLHISRPLTTSTSAALAP